MKFAGGLEHQWTGIWQELLLCFLPGESPAEPNVGSDQPSTRRPKHYSVNAPAATRVSFVLCLLTAVQSPRPFIASSALENDGCKS